jgi:hypothetical protein
VEETPKIIREYFTKHTHSNRMENREDTNKFSDEYDY